MLDRDYFRGRRHSECRSAASTDRMNLPAISLREFLPAISERGTPLRRYYVVRDFARKSSTREINRTGRFRMRSRGLRNGGFRDFLNDGKITAVNLQADTRVAVRAVVCSTITFALPVDSPLKSSSGFLVTPAV